MEEGSEAVRPKVVRTAARVIEAMLTLGLAILLTPVGMLAFSNPGETLPDGQSLPENRAIGNFETAPVESAQQAQPQFPAGENQVAPEATACREPATSRAPDQQLLIYGRSQPGVLYLVGEAMVRARRYSDAARLFQSLLELDPGNVGGELGLAGALAANGCYPDALLTYNAVLRQQPGNYAALQGSAFVLLWTGHLLQARTLFQRLSKIRPADIANDEGLSAISQASNFKRWKAMRPRPGAPPAAFLGYDMSYLAARPTDEDALRELVKTSAQLKYFAQAIRLVRQALLAEPHNQDLQLELASLLAWNHQYGPAISIYERMLGETPDNRIVLENLAKTYDWGGQFRESLQVEQRLSSEYPLNAEYQIAIIRLDLRLHDDTDERQHLMNFLRAHPHNREARLDLANLDLRQRRFFEAGKAYNVLLGQNFQDADALYGAARIDYYLGDLEWALPLARNLARERPKDLDALLLLARIETALHQRKAALAVLDQASALSPDNEEVKQVRSQLGAQPSVSLQTFGYYAREVALSNPVLAPSGALMPGATLEDLNTYGGSTRISFNALPQTSSYVLADVTPTNSPAGGIRGAAAPEEVLYGQATRLSRRVTVRGGFGVARMGPGEIFEVAQPPVAVRSVGMTPVGYIGASLLLTSKLVADLTASRSAITYTPTTARFGARMTRLEAGARYDFDSRTQLGLTFFHERDVSSVYDQTINGLGAALLEPNGRDSGSGATLALKRTVLRAGGSSLALGYDGLAMGYAGERRGVFMGFFNPIFYQRHFIAAEAGGHLWKRLGYDLTAAIGVQQTGEDEPFTRAEQFGPGLTVGLGERSSLSLRYVHYNFAQSLGSLVGNAVEFSTNYRF